MSNRLQATITDTGRAYPGAAVTKDRINSGTAVSLHGAKMQYTYKARIPNPEEFNLSDSADPSSIYTFEDPGTFGSNHPSITLTGSIDIDADTTTLGLLDGMTRSQGVKLLTGDFLSYLYNDGDSNVYVRITDLKINPPRYQDGKNRIDYQLTMMRVK